MKLATGGLYSVSAENDAYRYSIAEYSTQAIQTTHFSDMHSDNMLELSRLTETGDNTAIIYLRMQTMKQKLKQVKSKKLPTKILIESKVNVNEK